MKSFLIPFILGIAISSAAQNMHWQRVAQVPDSEFTALCAAGDTFFAASVNRVYFTTDGGSQWNTTAEIAPQVDIIISLHFAHGRLYVGTGFDGVYSSTNLGQSWQADNAGLTGLGAFNISGFAVRGDSLYAGTYGAKVFAKRISTNSPWSAYSAGMHWGNVESIANVNDTLYAGSGGNSTLSRQAYPSHAWTESPLGVFDGTSNSLLAITRHGGALLAAGNTGLYRSTDNGANWVRFNTGTGFLGYARFVMVGNRVIANLAKPAAISFLQYTDDAGMTWHNFQPAPPVSFGLDISFWNGQLYSARSNGLWRLSLTTPVEEPVSSPAVLEQNFPNPFINRTTIPVYIERSGPVRLIVFDAGGRTVQVLHQGQLTQGGHLFEFDGAGLPAGLYFYRLSGPNHTETCRMVLLH